MNRRSFLKVLFATMAAAVSQLVVGRTGVLATADNETTIQSFSFPVVFPLVLEDGFLVTSTADEQGDSVSLFLPLVAK